MTSKYDSIHRLYDKQTYLDKYILDVIIAILTCVLVIYYIFKHRIKEEIRDLNADWETHRCKPHYMPVAGFMKASPGNNVYEKTMENFRHCLSGIIDTNFTISLQPINKSIENVSTVFMQIAQAIGDIKFELSFLNFEISSIFDTVMDKMRAIVLELVKIIVGVKSILGQLQGIFITGIYALIATYYTSISGFIFMSDTLYTFAMVTFIYVAYALMATPFTFSIGMGLFIQGALLSVPLVLLNGFIKEAFGIKMTKVIPGRPGKKKKKCFSGYTAMKMNDGSMKTMCELNVGDTLSDGSTVTSTMISKNDCSFVKIDGVVVTIDHPILYDNKWIESQYHPSAIPIVYKSEYVYCIGTSEKVIRINGCIFSDWDEIRETDLEILSNITKNAMNLDKIDVCDIHRCFDTGYRKGTPISLNDGTIICIEDVRNGDILYNGNIVTTTVAIRTSDVDYFSYYYGDIHLFDATSNLSVDSFGKKVERIGCPSPDISYNLVTSGDVFYVSGIKLDDYNQGIEKHFPKSRWI